MSLPTSLGRLGAVWRDLGKNLVPNSLFSGPAALGDIVPVLNPRLGQGAHREQITVRLEKASDTPKAKAANAGPEPGLSVPRQEKKIQ